MLMKLRYWWQEQRSSFWFVPIAVVLEAVALATVLIVIDASIDLGGVERWPLLFSSGAAGARGLLTVVASSMITVAGLVFSITIVTLSLASSQYTSRVIRNFMRDRVNQGVLGIFVGIFAYCLVVLRTIRGGDEGVFVPALAVLVGLLLAFLGIAVLISVNRQRNLDQDAAFGIRQIVDIAMKALSPGINDTTTAIMCVDYLAAIMVRLATRRIGSPQYLDNGELRVIARDPSFGSLLSEAFDQIRQHGAGNIAIMLRMLGALQTIAGQTPTVGRCRADHEKVQCIADLAEPTIEFPYDQERFQSRLMQVQKAFVSC